MSTIINATIIILVIIFSIYLFLYFKKRKRPGNSFAFGQRQKDLTIFIYNLYPGAKADPEAWNEQVKIFKKEYPTFYNRIEKRFLDNYFKG